MNKIYQSVINSIEIISDRNRIDLTDDEIARIIQVRFQFKKFNYDDLIFALSLWQTQTGTKQVSIEEFYFSGDVAK